MKSSIREVMLRGVTQEDIEVYLESQSTLRQYLIQVFVNVQDQITQYPAYHEQLQSLVNGLRKREIEPLKHVRDMEFLTQSTTEPPSNQKIASVILSLIGCVTSDTGSKWEQVLSKVNQKENISPVPALQIQDHVLKAHDKMDRPIVNVVLTAMYNGEYAVKRRTLHVVLNNYHFPIYSPDLYVIVDSLSEKLDWTIFNMVPEGSSEKSNKILANILKSIISRTEVEPNINFHVLHLISALKSSGSVRALKEDLDMSEWLFIVTEDEYPADIVEATEELAYAIRTQQPSVELEGVYQATLGMDPLEKLLALLSRLTVVPNDEAIASPAHALYPHVKLKYLLTQGQYFHPQTAADIGFLLNSFLTVKNGLNPTFIREIFKSFAVNQMHWEELLKDFNFLKYSKPRSLLLEVLKELLKHPNKLQPCDLILFSYFIETNLKPTCSQPDVNSKSTIPFLPQVVEKLDDTLAPVNVYPSMDDLIIMPPNPPENTVAPSTMCPPDQLIKVVDPNCILEIIESKFHANYIIDLIKYNLIPADKYPYDKRYAIYQALLDDLKTNKYTDDITDFVITQALQRLPLNYKSYWPPTYLFLCPQEIATLEALAPSTSAPPKEIVTPVLELEPEIIEPVTEPVTEGSICDERVEVIDQNSLLDIIATETHVNGIKEIILQKPIFYQDFLNCTTQEQVFKAVLNKRRSETDDFVLDFVLWQAAERLPISWKGDLPPKVLSVCPQDLQYNIQLPPVEEITRPPPPTCDPSMKVQAIDPYTLIDIMDTHFHTQFVEKLLLEQPILVSVYGKYATREAVFKAVLEERALTLKEEYINLDVNQAILRIPLSWRAELPPVIIETCVDESATYIPVIMVPTPSTEPNVCPWGQTMVDLIDPISLLEIIDDKDFRVIREVVLNTLLLASKYQHLGNRADILKAVLYDMTLDSDSEIGNLILLHSSQLKMNEKGTLEPVIASKCINTAVLDEQMTQTPSPTMVSPEPMPMVTQPPPISPEPVPIVTQPPLILPEPVPMVTQPPPISPEPVPMVTEPPPPPPAPIPVLQPVLPIQEPVIPTTQFPPPVSPQTVSDSPVSQLPPSPVTQPPPDLEPPAAAVTEPPPPVATEYPIDPTLLETARDMTQESTTEEVFQFSTDPSFTEQSMTVPQVTPAPQHCASNETLAPVYNTEDLLSALDTTAVSAPFILSRIKDYIVPISLERNYTRAEVLDDILTSLKDDFIELPVFIAKVDELKKHVTFDGPGAELPQIVWSCLPTNIMSEIVHGFKTGHIEPSPNTNVNPIENETEPQPVPELEFTVDREDLDDTCLANETATTIVNTDTLFSAVGPTAPKAPYVRSRIRSYIIPLGESRNFTKGDVLRDVLLSLKEEVDEPKVIANINTMILSITNDGDALQEVDVIEVCLPSNIMDETDTETTSPVSELTTSIPQPTFKPAPPSILPQLPQPDLTEVVRPVQIPVLKPELLEPVVPVTEPIRPITHEISSPAPPAPPLDSTLSPLQVVTQPTTTEPPATIPELLPEINQPITPSDLSQYSVPVQDQQTESSLTTITMTEGPQITTTPTPSPELSSIEDIVRGVEPSLTPTTSTDSSPAGPLFTSLSPVSFNPVTPASAQQPSFVFSTLAPQITNTLLPQTEAPRPSVAPETPAPVQEPLGTTPTTTPEPTTAFMTEGTPRCPDSQQLTTIISNEDLLSLLPPWPKAPFIRNHIKTSVFLPDKYADLTRLEVLTNILRALVTESNDIRIQTISWLVLDEMVDAVSQEDRPPLTIDLCLPTDTLVPPDSSEEMDMPVFDDCDEEEPEPTPEPVTYTTESTLLDPTTVQPDCPEVVSYIDTTTLLEAIIPPTTETAKDLLELIINSNIPTHSYEEIKTKHELLSTVLGKMKAEIANEYYNLRNRDMDTSVVEQWLDEVDRLLASVVVTGKGLTPPDSVVKCIDPQGIEAESLEMCANPVEYINMATLQDVLTRLTVEENPLAINRLLNYQIQRSEYESIHKKSDLLRALLERLAGDIESYIASKAADLSTVQDLVDQVNNLADSIVANGPLDGEPDTVPICVSLEEETQRQVTNSPTVPDNCTEVPSEEHKLSLESTHSMEIPYETIETSRIPVDETLQRPSPDPAKRKVRKTRIIYNTNESVKVVVQASRNRSDTDNSSSNTSDGTGKEVYATKTTAEDSATHLGSISENDKATNETNMHGDGYAATGSVTSDEAGQQDSHLKEIKTKDTIEGPTLHHQGKIKIKGPTEHAEGTYKGEKGPITWHNTTDYSNSGVEFTNLAS